MFLPLVWGEKTRYFSHKVFLLDVVLHCQAMVQKCQGFIKGIACPFSEKSI
jgi:hypothetical protein